jgi:hypothetical protein
MQSKKYQVIYTMQSGDRIVSVEEGLNLQQVITAVAKHLESEKFVNAVNMKDRVLRFDPKRVESYGIRHIDPKEVAQKVIQASGDHKPAEETLKA